MNCLMELCFVAGLYLTGSVGAQSLMAHEGIDYNYNTNEYGRYIGEASLVLEFTNGLYFELKHISGLNTEEIDQGLNAIMVGAKIDLFGGK